MCIHLYQGEGPPKSSKSVGNISGIMSYFLHFSVFLLSQQFSKRKFLVNSYVLKRPVVHIHHSKLTTVNLLCIVSVYTLAGRVTPCKDAKLVGVFTIVKSDHIIVFPTWQSRGPFENHLRSFLEV